MELRDLVSQCPFFVIQLMNIISSCIDLYWYHHQFALFESGIITIIIITII